MHRSYFVRKPMYPIEDTREIRKERLKTLKHFIKADQAKLIPPLNKNGLRKSTKQIYWTISSLNISARWKLSNLASNFEKFHIQTWKFEKAFSKFYYRHSELIVKYNIGLKTLLQQGISEPIFYGDLVYKLKRIVGKPNFSDQFKKIVKRYIRVGYNLDIMRQSACLVVNPITVYSYGFLFNCTTVGQASDSMTALT